MSSDKELIKLNNLYASGGSNKRDWEKFTKDINNDYLSEKIVFYLEKNMKENPKNELTVDIIDFVLEFGNQKIISLIGQKQFLDAFLNLLKSETNAGVENQKKVIFLTKKWANKFSGNQSLSIFNEYFNFLKGNGIAFPPDSFVLKTYDKFVNYDEIQSYMKFNQDQNNDFNNNNINNSNQNFPFNNNPNNNGKGTNTFDSFQQQNKNGFPQQSNDGFPQQSNDGFPQQNNDGFPQQSNDGFPQQNNDGFPQQSNNGFPMQNNNDFPRNDNFNYNGSNNAAMNNYSNNNNYNNFNFNNNDNFNNNNNNYNFNNNNPYNNNNFGGFSNNFNNSNNNYKFNNNNFPNYGNTNTNMLIDLWKTKIKTYNGYIDEGKYSYHAIKLKEGINEILNSISNIDNEMNECMNRGDDDGRNKLMNIKSDMEQTCFRYECLKNDKKVDKFQSAFDGNSKRYFFDRNGIFKEKEYIPYSKVEQENPVLSGLEEFGNKLKDGAFFVGNKIKDAAVGGYDYVKDKFNSN